jgi:hypothetical protein
MVVNRGHYLAMGGHDQSFWGHGGEDYEFLHRLSSCAPKGPRPPFYYTDFRDNGRVRYRGFRAAFALYGLDVFGDGLCLMHLHHPSRPIREYMQRGRNFRLLREKMQAFDETGLHPPPLSSADAGEVDPPFQAGADLEPLDSDIYMSFGGAAAIARAVRIAAIGETLRADLGRAGRNRTSTKLKLLLYHLLAGLRRPRRLRPILRHIPPRPVARLHGFMEQVALAWLEPRCGAAGCDQRTAAARGKGQGRARTMA